MTQSSRSISEATAMISEEFWALFRMHADLCKVLGNERRLAILWLLGQAEMSVSEMADALDMSIHNVSQHLRVMKEQGVVRGEKRGQSVFYALSNEKFIQGCTLIRAALVEQHLSREKFLAGLGPLLPEGSEPDE